MSYKPLDRSVVRTKELLLEDGLAYDQYYDPFLLAARNMWKDIEGYNAAAGVTLPTKQESLKIEIPNW